MLNKEKIEKLLIESLQNYINSLEKDDLNYLQHKGEIIAYTNILGDEKINTNYLDINKAKKFLSELKDSKVYRASSNDEVLK